MYFIIEKSNTLVTDEIEKVGTTKHNEQLKIRFLNFETYYRL
jgi:hypothetical protein